MLMTCDHCGEEFDVDVGYGIPGVDKVFCSNQCCIDYEDGCIEFNAEHGGVPLTFLDH